MHIVKRRSFLQQASLGALGLVLPSRALFAQTAPTVNSKLKTRLIYIALRGGPDGQELLPAIGDPAYAAVRKGLARQEGVHRLDDTFALSKKLPFMAELYKKGELAILPATQMGHDNRSHFDAQKLTENGYTNPLMLQSGWLNRTVSLLAGRAGVPLAADTPLAWVPYDDLPVLLDGDFTVSTLQNADGAGNTRRYDPMLALYDRDDPFAVNLRQGISERETFKALLDGNPDKNSGDVKKLAEETWAFTGKAGMAGRLMSTETGPRFAFLETGGFDSHKDQNIDGEYGKAIANIDNGLKVLVTNLGEAWKNTLVLVGGEFGRTVTPNGTGGTDHGIAGTWFVAGGLVNGGRLYGDWPGLSEDKLLEKQYLRQTVHLASAFKAILNAGYGLTRNDLDKVLPDYVATEILGGLAKGGV